VTKKKKKSIIIMYSRGRRKREKGISFCVFVRFVATNYYYYVELGVKPWGRREPKVKKRVQKIVKKRKKPVNKKDDF
jgi:hypothetical protein